MKSKISLTEEELEEIRLKNLLGLGWEAEYAAQAGSFNKKLNKYLKKLPLNREQRKELINSFMKKWDKNPDKTEAMLDRLITKKKFPSKRETEVIPDKKLSSDHMPISDDDIRTKDMQLVGTDSDRERIFSDEPDKKIVPDKLVGPGTIPKVAKTTPTGGKNRTSPERLEEPVKRRGDFANKIFGTSEFGSFEDASPEEREKMQKISKSLATFVRNNRKSKSFRDIVKKKDGKKQIDSFLKKIARGIMRGNIPLSVFNKMALKENSLDEIKSRLTEMSAMAGGAVQGYAGNKRKIK